jgi:choline dehydrogenase-like flavoprotein
MLGFPGAYADYYDLIDKHGIDEPKYSIRKGMMQDVTREAMTFLQGTGLGGSGAHWNGQTWCFQAADVNYKTHIEQRYGKKILDPDLRIQDWGVTYQELEPYYVRFEYLLGVCGKAGNIKGKIQPGGNPLEPPRSREYLNPPMNVEIQSNPKVRLKRALQTNLTGASVRCLHPDRIRRRRHPLTPNTVSMWHQLRPGPTQCLRPILDFNEKAKMGSTICQISLHAKNLPLTRSYP